MSVVKRSLESTRCGFKTMSARVAINASNQQVLSNSTQMQVSRITEHQKSMLDHHYCHDSSIYFQHASFNTVIAPLQLVIPFSYCFIWSKLLKVDVFLFFHKLIIACVGSSSLLRVLPDISYLILDLGFVLIRALPPVSELN